MRRAALLIGTLSIHLAACGGDSQEPATPAAPPEEPTVEVPADGADGGETLESAADETGEAIEDTVEEIGGAGDDDAEEIDDEF